MKKAQTKWFLIWGCWTLAAFFFTSEVVFRGGSVYPIGSWEMLLRELINNYVWFALTPLVVRLAHRMPIEKHKWKRGLIFHLCASVIVALFHVAAYTFILHVSGLAIVSSTYWHRFQVLLTFNFHTNITCYWIVFGIHYAVSSYRKQAEKDLRASQLEAKLAQSRLDVLKMQLHPHFLFNTLNTISVLNENDPKAANRMLVGLSDLLRIALEDTGRQEVPLRQELDFLERYLKIEQIRFEERLRVKINVEPETLDAQVPNLILQPLVENAVRHGIAPQISGGTVEICAKRENENLRLTVRDDGAGLAAKDAVSVKKGIGLSNTQARLKQMFSENYSFQISGDDGFLATMTIPFRTNDGAKSR